MKCHSEIYSYALYIFNIKIRYSWTLWKIFVNRNNICQINVFANRNNIHEMKFWLIGMGIYLWPKYQRIDSGRIYLQTICELFANYLRIENYLLNTVKHWVCLHHSTAGTRQPAAFLSLRAFTTKWLLQQYCYTFKL